MSRVLNFALRLRHRRQGSDPLFMPFSSSPASNSLITKLVGKLSTLSTEYGSCTITWRGYALRFGTWVGKKYSTKRENRAIAKARHKAT
jgi:hypothetical protein